MSLSNNSDSERAAANNSTYRYEVTGADPSAAQEFDQYLNQISLKTALRTTISGSEGDDAKESAMPPMPATVGIYPPSGVDYTPGFSGEGRGSGDGFGRVPASPFDRMDPWDETIGRILANRPPDEEGSQ